MSVMHRPARHAPTDAERPQITLADSIDFLACDVVMATTTAAAAAGGSGQRTT